MSGSFKGSGSDVHYYYMYNFIYSYTHVQLNISFHRELYIYSYRYSYIYFFNNLGVRKIPVGSPHLAVRPWRRTTTFTSMPHKSLLQDRVQFFNGLFYKPVSSSKNLKGQYFSVHSVELFFLLHLHMLHDKQAC